MKRKAILYITLVGLIGLLSNCKKDETKVTMLTNPVAPVINTVPDLTLTRAHGLDTLVFECTPVDPGFTASAAYYLEAAAAGTSFADPISVMNSVHGNQFKITQSDLNGILLKKFDADVATSVDFRLRAVLVVDAGTGAPGTSADPMEYISDTKTATVTLYGLPNLVLQNSGIDQKIESALGDGSYTGFVKLNTDNPFTLKDPDANIVYGAGGSGLAVDGGNITPSGTGWFILNANTTALTYSMDAYMIGLVGSATPNGWNTPDQKMDYDAKTGTWYITADLIVGEIKFRKNDGWAWNLGGTVDNLTQGGANIPIAENGNYTITLTIIGDATGTCTIVKN